MMILVYTGKGYRSDDYASYESNKFWIGEIKGSTLETRWGRLGTKGQEKPYPCGSASAAQQLLEKKVHEKKYHRKTPYRVVDESEFQRLALIGATIGTANKVSMFQWMVKKSGQWNPASNDLMLQDPGVEPGMSIVLHHHSGRDLTLLFTNDGVYQKVTGTRLVPDWVQYEPTEKKMIEMIDRVREALGHWVGA